MNHHHSQIENQKIKNRICPASLSLFHKSQKAQLINILYKLIINNRKMKRKIYSLMIHKYMIETSMLCLLCLKMREIKLKDR